MIRFLRSLFFKRRFQIYLFLLGLFVFLNVLLYNSFVWDDFTYILENPQIHTLNIFHLFQPNIFNEGGQYRPLTALFFALEYQIFHLSPFFWHLVSILLHITNTILLFTVLMKFFKKQLSFFLSLIFLVHPMQVESVSYIAAFGGPLSFLFGIAALCIATKEKIDKKRGLLISGLLLLSLLAKEAGFAFFVVVAAYVYFFKKKEARSLVFYEAGAFIGYCLIRLGIGTVFLAKPPLTPIARLDFLHRLTNIPAIFMYYLQTFFNPGKLVIDQQWVITNLSVRSFYLPLFFLMLILLMIFFVGRYGFSSKQKLQKAYMIFSLWFLFGMIFYLQIFPTDMTVADRWFYFPIVGFIGIFATIFSAYIDSLRRIKVLISISAIVLVIFFSFRTIVRNFDWRNGLTLFLHDSAIKTNYDLETNIGGEYFAAKEFPLALFHYKKAAALLPSEINLYNLCNTYANIGLLDDAKESCLRAFHAPDYLVTGEKRNYFVYERLGQIYLLQQDAKNADSVLLQGVHAYPQAGNAWALFAIAENMLGRKESALSALQKAKQYGSILPISTFEQRIQNEQQIQLK